MDAITQGKLYITRNIEGLEYVLKSVHVESVKHLTKELETTKGQLEEGLTLIEEMCVDDCGIDLAKEDRESLESIIMGNDEKCVKFLNKLKNERGE